MGGAHDVQDQLQCSGSRFWATTKCWVAKMEKNSIPKKHPIMSKTMFLPKQMKKGRPWRRGYEQSDQTLNIATVQNQVLFPAVKWCLVKILNPWPQLIPLIVNSSCHWTAAVSGFQMADRRQRDVDNLIAELGPDDARAALAAHGLAPAAAGFRIFSANQTTESCWHPRLIWFAADKSSIFGYTSGWSCCARDSCMPCMFWNCGNKPQFEFNGRSCSTAVRRSGCAPRPWGTLGRCG